MSIYTDCSEAAQRLLADPSLHSPDHRGFFTDLDVIALASHEHGPFSDGDIREALVQSANLLGKLFKTGQVARYGPVRLPGIREPDYARIATKIVHAHPDGPAKFRTPNGVFPKLMVWNDHNLRAGRRFGTNRSDLERWTKEDQQSWELAARVGAARRHRATV